MFWLKKRGKCGFGNEISGGGAEFDGILIIF